MFQRILIVVGQQPLASTPVKQGIELAATHGAELVLFAMLPLLPIAMSESMAFASLSPGDLLDSTDGNARESLRLAAQLAEEAGVAARALIGCGEDSARCIVEAARSHECDLIVVGSAGANAVLRLLNGSPIPGLITEASIPVLVCKAAPSDRVVAMAMAKALAAQGQSK